MAIIPSSTQFIGIAASVNLTEKKSSQLNSETQPYTMQDIIDTAGGGGGSPAGTAGQIQFSDGSAFAADSNLYWNNTNKRLGVGTSSPTAILQSENATNGVLLARFKDAIASTSYIDIKNDTTLNDYIGLYWGSDYRILSKATSALFVNCAYGVNFADGLATKMTITSSGFVGVGETTPTARVHIKGSGSTSATTSLLVQDSAGTELFRVRDDGQTITRGTIQFNQANAIIDGEGWYSASTNKTVNMYGDGAVSSGVRVTGSSYSGGASQIQIKGATSISSGFNQPDASAQLDIQSTTKGFLPPRMTTTQKNAISTPAAGLQVYDTTLNQMSYYNGSTWVNF